MAGTLWHGRRRSCPASAKGSVPVLRLHAGLDRPTGCSTSTARGEATEYRLSNSKAFTITKNDCRRKPSITEDLARRVHPTKTFSQTGVPRTICINSPRHTQAQ